jgi:hypothetical protein
LLLLLRVHPEVVPIANAWLAAVWGVTARELGVDEDGTSIDRGGKMLNIWSSE